MREDALLLVSELVTNAVMHAGPPVRLAVDCQETLLRLGVHDCAPDFFAVPASDQVRGVHAQVDADLDQLAEHGRGLLFLELLALSWHIEPDATGKYVWFDVRIQ